MTTTTALPAYKGEEVSRATIKITGAGTGMSDGLAVAPIALELDEADYFIVRASCAEVGHIRDKNGLLVRTHRLHTEEMAPIDRETAVKTLAEYADMIEKAKAERSGQLLLGAEDEALEREAKD